MKILNRQLSTGSIKEIRQVEAVKNKQLKILFILFYYLGQGRVGQDAKNKKTNKKKEANGTLTRKI